jgi:hypothetical protein
LTEWNVPLEDWGVPLQVFEDEINYEIPDFENEKSKDCIIERCPKCGFEWEKLK